MLLGPAAMVATMIIGEAGAGELLAKSGHEALAIGLTITAVLACAAHLAFTRHAFHLLLLALAISVMFREFHWEWTTRGIFVAIGVLAVVAVIIRNRLFPFTDAQPALRVWLIATGCTYVLSQVVARKFFQFMLPDGSSLWRLFELYYDDMEEIVENVAHAMLILTSLVGTWRAGEIE